MRTIIQKSRPKASTAFELDADITEPSRSNEVRETFAELKARMLRDAVTSTPVLRLHQLFKLAADEAAAHAWDAGHPLLIFPTLFEEFLSKLKRENKRQQEVQRRSERMLEEVA